MSEKLVLLGVKHLSRNLPIVETFLTTRGIKDKKVLTEFDMSERKLSHEFYGPLLKFLESQGAVTIHETGEHSLSIEGQKEYDLLYREKHKAEWSTIKRLEEEAIKSSDADSQIRIINSQTKLLGEHFDEFFQLNSKYRNPNILKLILKEKPDYVVIGNGHIEAIYPKIIRKIYDRMVEYKIFE